MREAFPPRYVCKLHFLNYSLNKHIKWEKNIVDWFKKKTNFPRALKCRLWHSLQSECSKRNLISIPRIVISLVISYTYPIPLFNWFQSFYLMTKKPTTKITPQRMKTIFNIFLCFSRFVFSSQYLLHNKQPTVWRTRLGKIT